MRRKEQAKALWNMCFNDSENFTELYFRKRYTDYNTIGLSEDGAMATVMQLLPYPFHLFNRQLPSAYVSGACTNPEYRNKGLMSKLLKKGLNSLNDTGIPICTLIPANDWLYGYYRHSGFETVFFNTTTSFDFKKKISTEQYSLIVEDTYSPKAYEFLEKCLTSYPCSILHTKDDYEVILEDLRLANGKVFLLSEFGQVVAIAIAYFNSEDGSIHINELQNITREAKDAILSLISDHFNTSHFMHTHAATAQSTEQYGMLRIVKAQDVLEVFAKAKPEMCTQFYLEDDIIKANQGIYNVEQGKVSFEAVKEQPAGVEKWSIEKLASELFKPLQPYMSLMLD